MTTRSCTLFSTSVWHRRQLWSNLTKQERYGLEYVVQMYCQYRDSVLKEGLFYHAYKRIPYEPIETFLTADVACKGVGWFPRRWVQGIGEFPTQAIFLFRSLSRLMSILRSGAHHQLSFNGCFLMWATSESLPGLRLPHWWRQRQAGAALWDLSLETRFYTCV